MDELQNKVLDVTPLLPGLGGLATGSVLEGASLMAQWVKNLPAMQETQEMCI